MFNKNKYKKMNDKKILHKIKSHWCVISVALLGMIGGAAMTQANVNADVNPQNSDNNQVNHSVSSVSSTQNESQLVNNQSNHGDLYGVHHDNVNDVSSQSTNLHNRIVKQGAQTSRYHSIHNSRLLGTSAGASSSSMNASQASMIESSEVSSAAASKVAHGGHWISVSPSVRSDMMSGASEIASYNQITRSNAYATASYLDSLSATTPELASEKSSAESYVQKFYGNKQVENGMIMDNEAAHDIKIWGEDPDFFTLYQAEPTSIVNNVRTIYEPKASAYTYATSFVETRVKSFANPNSPAPTSSSGEPASSSETPIKNDSNSQNNFQPSSSLSTQSNSSNVAQSASNNYSSSVASSSSNLRTLRSVPLSSDGNNVSRASNVAKNKAVNKSDNPSTDQKTSADPDDSDADDEQADPQDPSTNSAGARSSDPSTNNAQWNAKGISNVNNDQNGQAEQAGIAHDSAPAVNNDPVDATDNVSDNQDSSNGKLPQTNEASSSKSKEMSEISLIMSTTFGALGMYIDKHRRDND